MDWGWRTSCNFNVAIGLFLQKSCQQSFPLPLLPLFCLVLFHFARHGLLTHPPTPPEPSPTKKCSTMQSVPPRPPKPNIHHLPSLSIQLYLWSFTPLYFSNSTITNLFPHLSALNTHHANSHWQTFLLILISIHPSQLHFFLAQLCPPTNTFIYS